MQSKRRRCLPREASAGSAESLRCAYIDAVNGTGFAIPLDRDGDHPTLRWLIHCARIAPSARPCSIPVGVHLRNDMSDVIENINALRSPMSVADLASLESQVAAWVMGRQLPAHVIAYLASFSGVIALFAP